MTILAATTTRLADRMALTAGMLLVMALIYLAMWRGWNRHDAAHDSVLPDWPDRFVPDVRAGGVYASTTIAGEWMQRIRSHGLGSRSRVEIAVGAEGVAITRTGAPLLFIPADRITNVTSGPGIAGKVVGGRGLLVISWQLGRLDVDTGLLPDPSGRADLTRAAMKVGGAQA